MNEPHTYKVWTGTGWTNLNDLRSDEKTEAERKGIVEHSEWCWCIDDAITSIGNPPF